MAPPISPSTSVTFSTRAIYANVLYPISLAPMYETPTKGDLDRNLSMILHEAHQKARAERARLTSEYAARGMSRSTSLIGATIGVLDAIHRDAIPKAITFLHSFATRVNLPVVEITGWARPHIENLGNSVLGELPAAGF